MVGPMLSRDSSNEGKHLCVTVDLNLSIGPIPSQLNSKLVPRPVIYFLPPLQAVRLTTYLIIHVLVWR